MGSSQQLKKCSWSKTFDSLRGSTYKQWIFSIGNGWSEMKRSGIFGACRERPLGTTSGWINAIDGKTRWDKCRPSLTIIQRLFTDRNQSESKFWSTDHKFSDPMAEPSRRAWPTLRSRWCLNKIWSGKCAIQRHTFLLYSNSIYEKKDGDFRLGADQWRTNEELDLFCFLSFSFVLTSNIDDTIRLSATILLLPSIFRLDGIHRMTSSQVNPCGFFSSKFRRQSQTNFDRSSIDWTFFSTIKVHVRIPIFCSKERWLDTCFIFGFSFKGEIKCDNKTRSTRHWCKKTRSKRGFAKLERFTRICERRRRQGWQRVFW